MDTQPNTDEPAPRAETTATREDFAHAAQRRRLGGFVAVASAGMCTLAIWALTQGFIFTATTQVAATLVLVGMAFWARRGGPARLRLAVQLSLGFLLTVILGMQVHNAFVLGRESAAFWFIGVIPVAAAYLVSARAALAWAAACSLAIVLFYVGMSPTPLVAPRGSLFKAFDAWRAGAEFEPVPLTPGGAVLYGANEIVLLWVLAGFAWASRRATDQQVTRVEELNTSLESRVTERTRDLEAAVAEARAAARAKTIFVANMSHEIRTPLNGVLGVAEVLADTSLDESQRDLLGMLRSSGETLLETLSNILDLAKVESGNLELEHAPFDPTEVLERCVEERSAIAHPLGLELHSLCHSGVPHTVVGDALRFRQVLGNLVDNAVKFTARGHVVVSLWPEPLDDGRVELHTRVEDTGPGVAVERLHEMFETFTQADSTSSKPHAGTGVGLALSNQLTRLMGGRLDVESEPGRGSAFTVVVPFEVADENSLPSPTCPRRSVLLVAADTTTREVARAVLEQLGADVYAPSETHEAPSLLGPATDIVVLDASTPEDVGNLVCERAAGLRGDKDGSPAAGPQLVVLAPKGLPWEACVPSGWHHTARLTKPIRSEDVRRLLLDCPEAPAAPGTTTVAPASRRGSILIVEDNIINQRVAQAMVASLGYDVLVADNGQLGVDAYTREHEKLVAVLMDCQMPVLDGYGTARAIREIEAAGRLPRVPIIAVTANALASDREKCLAAGMDDHLPKPTTRAQLGATLGRWVATPA